MNNKEYELINSKVMEFLKNCEPSNVFRVEFKNLKPRDVMIPLYLFLYETRNNGPRSICPYRIQELILNENMRLWIIFDTDPDIIVYPSGLNSHEIVFEFEKYYKHQLDYKLADFLRDIIYRDSRIIVGKMK